MGKREMPHEGIDLCYYRDSAGEIKRLDAGAKIPVIFPGRVELVIKDFLGKSVFVSHNQFKHNEKRLFTIYGHTEPSPDTKRGTTLNEGDILGTIADPAERKLTVLPHLHISVAWIPDSLPTEEYNWNNISNPEKISLLDPLDVLDLPHTIVSSLE